MCTIDLTDNVLARMGSTEEFELFCGKKKTIFDFIATLIFCRKYGATLATLEF